MIHLHIFSVWCNRDVWLKTKAYSPSLEGAYAPNTHLLPSSPMRKTSWTIPSCTHLLHYIFLVPTLILIHRIYSSLPSKSWAWCWVFEAKRMFKKILPIRQNEYHTELHTDPECTFASRISHWIQQPLAKWFLLTVILCQFSLNADQEKHIAPKHRLLLSLGQRMKEQAITTGC